MSFTLSPMSFYTSPERAQQVHEYLEKPENDHSAEDKENASHRLSSKAKVSNKFLEKKFLSKDQATNILLSLESADDESRGSTLSQDCDKPSTPRSKRVLKCGTDPPAKKARIDDPPAPEEQTEKTLFPLFRRKTQSETKPAPEQKQKKSPAPRHSRRKLLSTYKDQYILDMGQKGVDAVHTCPSCGMLYNKNSPVDEATHLAHHERTMAALKFPGWKKERVVREYADGRVIVITGSDPAVMRKKATDILEVVDGELGFVASSFSWEKALAFVFVDDKRVIGFCLAQQITTAYRVLDSGPTNERVEPLKAWQCSKEPCKAICGISRVWVSPRHRRQRIATRLVHCVREQFSYGSYLAQDELAFSDPTPDGKLFAMSYTKTPQFLVYKHTQ